MRTLFGAAGFLWHRMGRPPGRPRVLVIDDYVPDPRIGAGAPRALALMRAIIATGASLTILPAISAPGQRGARRRLLPQAHAAFGYGLRRLGCFLGWNRDEFDLIIVSRPHNMMAFLGASAPGGPPVIYDAEALFATREAQQRVLDGNAMTAEEMTKSIQTEAALARGTRMVLAVDSRTAQTFRAAGHADVRVLGHAVTPKPTSASFEDRNGFLFVGPTYSDAYPNTDAVVWFADDVLPAIRKTTAAPFMVAGRSQSSRIAQRASLIDMLGEVDDLAEAYGRARVFVAPTRIASGLPFKVHHAAAHGIPAVVTPLLAEQLGWEHERELLVADTADQFAVQCLRLHGDRALWQRIRESALARVAQDCDPQVFNSAVARMLADAASRQAP